MSSSNNNRNNSTSYVGGVIALYWVVSISMVYLNKLLLSNDIYSIPAPIFVTWFQCVVTCLICMVLGDIGEKHRNHGQNSFYTEYPKVSFVWNEAISVMPLSIAFVGMIAFNNICLQYVEVSFYNVARSLSLVFNVVLTLLILGKITNLSTCSTLIVIIIGFYVGIEGEVNLSLMGTISGVVASLFVSLTSIYTAKVLPAVNNDKALLLYYNNLNASIMFIPLMLIFESKLIFAHAGKFVSFLFWVGMTLSGVMGFAIGLVTVMQVKATSPLTHNISGTAKAAVQSLLAFYIWGNPATVQGIIGMLLVIVGSGLYTWVQMRSSVVSLGSPSSSTTSSSISSNDQAPVNGGTTIRAAASSSDSSTLINRSDLSASKSTELAPLLSESA